ncbi:MAG TPA: diguanylate cyclase [Thermodesulfovibrionales bacterium]|nr:diguanylate cyclase [Thermodesulfovibrionales bacterium]
MTASINSGEWTEKRGDNRLPLTASVYYSPILDKYKYLKVWGVTSDVSPSGLSIYAYHPLKRGSCLTVHSNELLGDERDATVMWCKEVGKNLYRSGLFFHESVVDIGSISQETAEHARCVEEELKQSKQMIEDITQSITDSIMLLSKDLKIRWVNQSAIEQTGLSKEEIVGSYCYKVIHDREQPCKSLGNPCPVSELVETEKPAVYEQTYYDRDGRELCAEITCYPVKNDTGEIVSVVHFSRDITERKKTEEELRALSLTDELTGLHNRRGFFFLAEKLLTIARRQEKRLLMLYADVDGLKEINDTWGHHAGDLALIETANILKSTYRESDIIARMGGDEFVIFQIESTGNDSETASVRLQQRIDARNAGRKEGERLSISMGISCFDPGKSFTIDAMLSNADRAMYEKKRLRRKL